MKKDCIFYVIEYKFVKTVLTTLTQPLSVAAQTDDLFGTYSPH